MIAHHVGELRSIAEHLKSIAEESRSGFTDASRPQFDARVIDAMRSEIGHLAARASELDAALEDALRMMS